MADLRDPEVEIVPEERVQTTFFLGRSVQPWLASVQQVEVVQTFSSGCGGPSYGWTSDGYIAIGGEIKQQALPPDVPQWVPLAADAAARHGIPLQYVLGVISLESGGKANAGSPAGAMGLMQLLQSTANSMAGRKLTVEEVYDPATNIDLGCKLLAQLLSKYGGDPIKASFAYNAGSARCGAGCVRDYKAAGRPCIEPCSGNQFGLFADCYASTHVTVDYGGRVAKYSNEALATGVAVPPAPPEPPVEEDTDSGSSSSGAGWVLLGLLAVGGALLYTRPKMLSSVFGGGEQKAAA